MMPPERLLRCFAPVSQRDTPVHIQDEQGQAVVEAALTLPVICAFLFLTIEVCLLFYSYCMISECARQGTRYAMVHGANCTTTANASCTTTLAEIKSYTEAIGWPNFGGGTLTATPSSTSSTLAAGSQVTVLVTYSFPINLPFVPQGTLAMKSTSTTVIVQ
jgi:Flp pilus assembly protein TadG